MTDLVVRLELFMSNPLTVLLLTLGAYLIGEQLFIRTGRKGWFHPVIVGSLLVFLVIHFSSMSIETYREHSSILKTLLAPFTVALAIPLSQQLHHVRRHAGPILSTLLLGAVLVVLLGLGFAWVSGAESDVLLSVSTKGVTTAVALALSEKMGGIVPVAVAVVCISGIYGGLAGPWICRKTGVRDLRAIGFALGINAHAGGTAMAFGINPTMGVYSSLAMCLNAILTAMVLPFVITYLF
ncbi:LrgB family protein [Endozoicomonas euniceicola]|uniref:LrgB family protein n=1 Tax=Endozoicomonas euniceicola TaxID=1234143 RepID=A0ABY6GYB8_9GAMM|nr:LrgB family protein [Endozoicomonas euniceicola]UYM17379.1 LrgB family protein [Endozoicomonas euniceicola]